MAQKLWEKNVQVNAKEDGKVKSLGGRCGFDFKTFPKEFSRGSF